MVAMLNVGHIDINSFIKVSGVKFLLPLSLIFFYTGILRGSVYGSG